MGGFIVGFDSDQPDIFERQFEFIQQSGVVTAMVGLLHALPQTRLYQRLQREGRLRQRKPGRQHQRRVQLRAAPGRRVSCCDNYASSCGASTSRQLLPPHPHLPGLLPPRGPRRRADLPEVRAFLRSLWVMGILHSGRRAFWRFMASTLVHHPASSASR